MHPILLQQQTAQSILSLHLWACHSDHNFFRFVLWKFISARRRYFCQHGKIINLESTVRLSNLEIWRHFSGIWGLKPCLVHKRVVVCLVVVLDQILIGFRWELQCECNFSKNKTKHRCYEQWIHPCFNEGQVLSNSFWFSSTVAELF